MMRIRLNEQNSTVITPRGEFHLTPKEYDILNYLIIHADRSVSAEEIYTAVWGAEPFSCRTVVAVHICHLREKIEEDSANPRILKRIWTKGYIFSDE